MFNSMDELHMFMEVSRKADKAMSTSVRISHEQVTKITVKKLIEVRNANVNSGKDMSHFDAVLKHFLTDDEFEKYVNNGKSLEWE